MTATDLQGLSKTLWAIAADEAELKSIEAKLKKRKS